MKSDSTTHCNSRVTQEFLASLLSLLPDGIAAAAAEIQSTSPRDTALTVLPDHWHDSSSTRAKEFVAGRTAAAEALTALCSSSTKVLQDENRAPIWPAGTVGSISHAGAIAVAIASWSSRFASIGVDIEVCGRLHPQDSHVIANREDENVGDPTLLLSIKESAFKCVYPIEQRYIDFLDATVSIDWKQHSFGVTPCASLDRYFDPVQGYFTQWGGFWQVVSVMLHTPRN